MLLLRFDYVVCDMNRYVYDALLNTFEVWRQKRTLAVNPSSRALIFSPHPDDDVISMGGTLIQLADNGYEVHVAYQTSGNIAVFDDEVIRFLQFCLDFSPQNKAIVSTYKKIKKFLKRKKTGDIDTKLIQQIKGDIRKGEALAAADCVE